MSNNLKNLDQLWSSSLAWYTNDYKISILPASMHS
ncbi:hypothetical protein VINE108521_10395 [Vibrio neonatus]